MNDKNNNLEKFQIEIMQIFYGDSQQSLKEVTEHYQISADVVDAEWRQIALVSKKFQGLPEYQPSQMSLNKILAHANEKAQEMLAKKSFWSLQWLLKPSYAAFSMVLVVGIVTALSWQPGAPQVSKIKVANNKVQQDYHNVIQRLFSTPFDRDSYDPTYSLPQKSQHYLNSLVSNVSTGNSGDTTNSFLPDDDLDQKMLSNNVTASELDTLFFRARKFEKLGYYQDALRDYLFISKNYPEFAFQRTMPLSIAGCYEKLGDKKTAALVLDAYEKSYGKSDEVDLWVDQLKSETL